MGRASQRKQERREASKKGIPASGEPSVIPRSTLPPVIQHAGFMTALILACFYVYHASLGFGFVWDDKALILDNPDVRTADARGIFKHSLGQWGDFKSNAYRPVQMLSYALDHRFSAEEPSGYHRTNLLLHMLTVLFLYLLVSRFSGEPVHSFFASLLFAVHPMGVESVAYISGRSDILSLCFFLISFLAYLPCLAQASKGKGVLCLAVSSLFFTASIFSREAAAVYPLIITVYALGIARVRLKQFAVHAFFVFVVPLVVYAWARSMVTTEPWVPAVAQTLGERLTILPSILGHYLKVLILPMESDLHMEYLFGPYLRAASVATAAVGWAVWAGLFIWIYSKRRVWDKLVLFGLAWFVLALFPFLNILFVLNAPFSLHWLYVPAAGFFLALVGVMRQMANRWTSVPFAPRLAAGVLIILAFGFAHQARGYTRHWANDVKLYTQTVRWVPQSLRAGNNLCLSLQNEERYNEALTCFEDLVRRDPRNEVVQTNLDILKHKIRALRASREGAL